MYNANVLYMYASNSKEHFMEFKVQVDNTFSSQQSNVCVLYIVCVWKKIKKPTYFYYYYGPHRTFGTINGFYCISTNFYFYLQYF